MNPTKIIQAIIVCLVVFITVLMEVRAEWIQSTGQSEPCILLGGACVAKSGDFGAYYHNPASAAEFTSYTFGANVQLLDTRQLQIKDSAGAHDIPKTNKEGKIAIAPAMAAYWPINDKLNVGIGFGAPYAITADWTNERGIHRYNMSEEALFVMDLTPTVSYKFSEKLNIGASIHIVAFKHMRFETLIPDSFGAALPPELGGVGQIIPTTADSSIIGVITANTDQDLDIGLPPNDVSAVFDEYAFTLGMLYKYSNNLSLGVSYRSKTKSTWDGELTLDFSPSGGVSQTVDFELDLDLAAHLQAGMRYEAIEDTLIWSFDIQRTFWSDARGVGTPAVIKAKTPLLGFVNNIAVDYSGNDTTAYKSGIEYKIDEQWSVLAGITIEEAVFDDSHVDVLTYDTDRTLLSLGLQYLDSANNWLYTLGIQSYIYHDRTIKPGESQNLGGVSLPNLVNADTLGFSPNRGEFEYGGTIWSLGLGIQKSW